MRPAGAKRGIRIVPGNRLDGPRLSARRRPRAAAPILAAIRPGEGRVLFQLPASIVYTDTVLRRELHLLALYRILEASLLCLLVFSPVGALIGAPHDRALGVAVALASLPASLALWWWARRPGADLGEMALIGVVVDILIATFISHALPAAGPGVALLLVANIGGAALFLRLRVALIVAAVAALGLAAEFVWSVLEGGETRPLAEALMFGVSFFATATLTNLLGERMRRSQALAERRGEEAANLAGLNELIIRRMRTGVMIVDGAGTVQLANEAAGLIFAGHDGALEGSALPELSPDLARRLRGWRRDGRNDESPLACGPERIEVQPRFARLLPGSDSALVFLDDASLVSRRAESLTLSAMGRFSASLAHEIRNPLAAISYATQLLEESEDLSAPDRRLLQIIHQQCLRTNGIVESVLSLARRERAMGEPVDLVACVRRFVDEYQLTLQPENGSVRASGRDRPLEAVFDPRHLHQILTVLANNAIHHGRLPGEPARVSIVVGERDGRPAIEVVDRGPGIPEAVAHQVGRPFFTTSEHGTGLGLYIARELARANGADLDYVPVPAGGACFRLAMPGRNPLLSA
ncbi:HAMP domain-containing histidine kinase [Luteimonas sp. Y-2-2-4F]|nr:HAMP domain-containing sensor histidine kinase [Luteimonas sp. Y-2-2-4F]MCD9030598.1 HAMP domain-containing histidine kinase [Luteimonas sp. Y-2-2-4F]